MPGSRIVVAGGGKSHGFSQGSRAEDCMKHSYTSRGQGGEEEVDVLWLSTTVVTVVVDEGYSSSTCSR